MRKNTSTKNPGYVTLLYYKASAVEAMQNIVSNLTPYPFKFMRGQVSTLGGPERPTIMLVVSLQDKQEWKYGILENSPYAKISIDHKGVMEMFSGCLIPKLRKTKVKSTHDAIVKLHIWAEKTLSAKPF